MDTFISIQNGHKLAGDQYIFLSLTTVRTYLTEMAYYEYNNPFIHQHVSYRITLLIYHNITWPYSLYLPILQHWLMNPPCSTTTMCTCTPRTMIVWEWPWWKSLHFSYTLHITHVQSIFWLIPIYCCYPMLWCLDLFTIRRGIYHTSYLHRLPAESRKQEGEGWMAEGTAGILTDRNKEIKTEGVKESEGERERGWERRQGR